MELFGLIVIFVFFVLLMTPYHLLALERIQKTRAERLQYNGPVLLRVKNGLFWALGIAVMFSALTLFSTSIMELEEAQSTYKHSARLSEHLNSTDSGRLLKESGATLVWMPMNDNIEAYQSYPWLPHHTGIQIDRHSYISMLVRLRDDRWAVYVDPNEVEQKSSFKHASDSLDDAAALIHKALPGKKDTDQPQAKHGENPLIKWAD